MNTNPEHRSSLKRFFLAGKGLSFRTGKYFGESMLVGAAVGLVVVAFRYMIDFGTAKLLDGVGSHNLLSKLPDFADYCRYFTLESLVDPKRYLFVVLPALGALAGYLLIKHFASIEHLRGTDSAIRAFHHRGGTISGQVVPVKSVASVLTVGSGGSGGYEGPVTLIGAAVGSVIARRLKLSVRACRILMAAGLSAGIAALFQAPLAGALFGFEIFYSSSDVEYETLLPCFIASTISYSIFACFFGWSTLFAMPQECAYNSGLRLLPYFALAIVITYAARFYIDFFRKSEMRFATMRFPRWMKVALGGLMTGAIGFFFPDILGSSYAMIQSSFVAAGSEAFSSDPCFVIVVFIAFSFLKAIATAFTVSSGGSGGVFAPALVCGASLGAGVGMLFQKLLPLSFGINASAFALVGMAGFVAAAVRIPLSAIVMVSEISGNHMLLAPAMWVCGISFWLNNGWSLYRSQVHSRGSSPIHDL
jgi:CIC family chloride channel protein